MFYREGIYLRVEGHWYGYFRNIVLITIVSNLSLQIALKKLGDFVT